MTNLSLWDDSVFKPKPPENMESLQQSALNCTQCRLHETRTQVTWGQGDYHSPLMMVGMGPSVMDDQTGGVYTGIAGDFLDRMLHEAGLTRAKIYLTNAHKCVAKSKDDPNNIRTPTKTELKACREWLDGELALVKPKVLLCIGSPAAKWILGDGFELENQRGEWIENPLGCLALATYQPTYITRLQQFEPEKAEELYPLVVADFRKAGIAAGLILE